MNCFYSDYIQSIVHSAKCHVSKETKLIFEIHKTANTAAKEWIHCQCLLFKATSQKPKLRHIFCSAQQLITGPACSFHKRKPCHREVK